MKNRIGYWAVAVAVLGLAAILAGCSGGSAGEGDDPLPCCAFLDEDTDLDGFIDSADNCPAIANPDQADADADGQGDACETLDLDRIHDFDEDGVEDNLDNCPADSNPGQDDADGDGIGDSCDTVTVDTDPPSDRDRDGVADFFDNCPDIANADQADADGDWVGDACDLCSEETEIFCSNGFEISGDQCVAMTGGCDDGPDGSFVCWDAFINICQNACDNRVDGCAAGPKQEFDCGENAFLFNGICVPRITAVNIRIDANLNREFKPHP